MEIPQKVREVWDFLWHGKSMSSYIAFLLVSFLLLKFAIYPGFLFLTGWTDVVAVLSSSMHHGENIDTTFYSWLEDNGYDYNNWPFLDGLNVGDAVVVVKAEPDKIYVGDVIVFISDGGEPIIHRVVSKDGTKFTTKGDANSASIRFERNISYERIVGKAVAVAPLIGYPRVMMSRILGL
jgi:signal peptidase I